MLVGLGLVVGTYGQDSGLKIAKLKYNGGGDWYANKTALPNLISFCNANLKTGLAPEEEVVEVGSPELFLYPYVYMTGHGNVVFSDEEAENLRKYLLAGGFLHIDDNYGMDEFVRLEMKKVFPELEFVDLPPDHPIYQQKFTFKKGIPKIHEHDGEAPQGLGLLLQGSAGMLLQLRNRFRQRLGRSAHPQRSRREATAGFANGGEYCNLCLYAGVSRPGPLL